MRISVFVPEYGVIEAVTPPFRSFHTANEFLTAFGKSPIFKVEYVGLNEYVPANNGEYTIKTDRLLKDVTETDLLIIPPKEYKPTQQRFLILKSYTRREQALPVCVSVLFFWLKQVCSAVKNALHIGLILMSLKSDTLMWK